MPNSRFAKQVWGQGPGPVAIAITESRQALLGYRTLRIAAKVAPPKPAEGGFPYYRGRTREEQERERRFMEAFSS